MPGKRKHHTAAFKAQVALAAIKGDQTVADLASRHAVHPTLIRGWKKQLPAGAEGVFAGPPKSDDRAAEALRSQLYAKIGRPEMELDWLEKKSAPPG
jgi:putative transposase